MTDANVNKYIVRWFLQFTDKISIIEIIIHTSLSPNSNTVVCGWHNHRGNPIYRGKTIDATRTKYNLCDFV